VAFGYAQVPASGLPCPLASSLLIGEIHTGLLMVKTLLTGCRFLIWIGETILTAPIRQTADADDHWSRYLGSNQEKTFGPTISGLIFRHIGPERCLLWDSKREGGRPDTMRILKRVYNSWRAEGSLVYPICAMLAADTRPWQLSSSPRTTTVIRRSCRAARRRVFLRSARCGTSWVSHSLLSCRAKLTTFDK